MTHAVAELLEASRQLTDDQRRELAQAIWESVEDQNWKPSRAALDEVRRRRAEYLSVPGETMSSQEMWAQIDGLKSA